MQLSYGSTSERNRNGETGKRKASHPANLVNPVNLVNRIYKMHKIKTGI
jgi:hypothetical protein